jgi:PAS domain S-box-containing protein
VLEIDGIVISGYDITDRKCLEIELKASEEKYKSLVLNVPGAVFRCDSTYTMEFVSDRIEEITGYPAATFINNQRQSYLSIIYPEDITLIKDSLLQSVLDRYRCSIEYRIIHASGQIRWVSERKQGTFDQRGNLIWLDGVLQDISDRKRVEDEHRRSKAKRKLAETELRRCQAVNRAMAQLMPEYMRSNNQEAFQAFIVSRNIGSSD